MEKKVYIVTCRTAKGKEVLVRAYSTMAGAANYCARVNSQGYRGFYTFYTLIQYDL